MIDIEKITKNNNRSIVLKRHGLCLHATFFCGQTFSWQVHKNGYMGVAGARAAFVCEQNDSLVIVSLDGRAPSNAERCFWHHYFALDVNYACLHSQFSQNPKLAACVAGNAGIRVLRQPFFDTLLAFIISQNNNIPRIQGIVNRLRHQFGAQTAAGVYAFPTPQEILAHAPEAFSCLGAGYRVKYVLDAARKVASGEVCETVLQALPDDEALQTLMKIKGVGSKVASCVLLYGLGRFAVVPMDVWMRRALEHTFDAHMPKEAAGFEGIAQQYIFDWARQNIRK